jgi:hypothetical protein
VTLAILGVPSKYYPLAIFLISAGIPPVVFGAILFAAIKMEPFQQLVKDFEWTWTKAVVASLFLWFFAMALIVIVPSYWLYFADQTLGWRDTRVCGISWLRNCGFWLFKLRDAVAALLFSGPFGLLIAVSYYVQKLRRRLRSESASRPTGGYR